MICTARSSVQTRSTRKPRQILVTVVPPWTWLKQSYSSLTENQCFTKATELFFMKGVWGGWSGDPKSYSILSLQRYPHLFEIKVWVQITRFRTQGLSNLFGPSVHGLQSSLMISTYLNMCVYIYICTMIMNHDQREASAWHPNTEAYAFKSWVLNVCLVFACHSFRSARIVIAYACVPLIPFEFACHKVIRFA